MEETSSLWKHLTPKSDSYPPLSQPIEVDVAIIGAGITGVSAGLELIQAGKTVAILEGHKVGLGTTGYSTGNLYVAVQPYFQKMVEKFDLETAIAIAKARQETIEGFEQLIKAHSISCDFHRRPMYFYADSAETSQLEKEVEILKKSEMPIEYVKDIPLPMPFSKAAVIQNQARFNPLQFVVSLAKIITQLGGQIFEQSRVIEIKETKDHCSVKTENAYLIAKNVIIATHTPIGINPRQFFTAPYRSYVVAVKLEDGNYPEMHSWNMEKPHYSICTHTMTHDKPDLLVIAGSHHKTGQETNTMAHFTELEHYLEKNWSVKNIQFKWSAQHYHSADTVPYIGLNFSSSRIYQATGFFADGLIYGALSGKILSHLILREKTKKTNIFDSRRSHILASIPFLLKENFNVYLQYLKDLPTPSLKQSDYQSRIESEIKKGEGKVLTIEGEKCGVYRDDEGKFHVVSAVCTHMKGIVAWNSAERTWDCPCHGSRFTHSGKVIEGPAVSDLPKKETK